ncbi:hypothetical protein [Desulfomicrobium norvegicum]|uniref:hypothetical protein n=1 Tax=Desulfomicrobium norvegicum (strain DSM 1741 / NCIMB 8310) TaxID=52561 RepID=UPI00116032A2|nr:hypothetical protein [Desulfomicrobium norvegicum]
MSTIYFVCLKNKYLHTWKNLGIMAIRINFQKIFLYGGIMVRIFVFILLCTCLLASGCEWVGRSVGKAQAKIERKTDAVIDGYNDGYSSEKNKNNMNN